MIKEVDLMLKLVTKKARQCGMEQENVKRRMDEIFHLMEQTDKPARETSDKEAEDIKQLLSWKYTHLQSTEEVSKHLPMTHQQATVTEVETITI